MLGWISGWTNNTSTQSTGSSFIIDQSVNPLTGNIVTPLEPISPPSNGRIIDENNSLSVPIDNYIPSSRDIPISTVNDTLILSSSNISVLPSSDIPIPLSSDIPDPLLDDIPIPVLSDIFCPNSPPIFADDTSSVARGGTHIHAKEHSRMFLLCKKLNPNRKWPEE